MTTCNKCGHSQADVISSADIEAIQFQSILLQGRCESLESENSSLRTMLKTQSEQHHERQQEIVKDFESEIERIHSRDISETDALRSLNEYLRKCVLDLNQKLSSSDSMVIALKDQLDNAVKRNNELIKNTDDSLKHLESQLIKALEYADSAHELACARDIDGADAGTINRKDMLLRLHPEELEESALSSNDRSFCCDSENGSHGTISSDLRKPTGPHGYLINMMREESSDESDNDVVAVTDENVDFVF
uniref:Uncharacterized protein n=1 Tax=Panagrolaimus sp. ES5 TaxID=591445 RepID=A0AC34FAV5_9BILA